ncbi:hypothetical protein CC80DRAFT_511281 [Byssothecium circinans]|uniref:Biotin carboxylation domain-containing protein n=1 Tax=Byssothecium circinans TaxID=147558 RepID=A0A6A5T8Q1_9PLEO|nr:hypothetical protein CC80DRAFT_511281 [Byssothecium circinans]
MPCGYGFLSESAVFAKLNITTLPPSQLPQPPLKKSSPSPPNQLPIMLKAVVIVVGGGICLIHTTADAVPTVKRAVEESPLKKVFATKAAIDGFRHIEVQTLGDETVTVTHFSERKGSIQRRYQKVVEEAHSAVVDRGVGCCEGYQGCGEDGDGGVCTYLSSPIVILMRQLSTSPSTIPILHSPSHPPTSSNIKELNAPEWRAPSQPPPPPPPKTQNQLSYCSLVTFEFLLHRLTLMHHFLETNLRLRVKHTITKSLTNTDIPKIQLLLSLAVIVSPEFNSLIAKVIVTSSSRRDVVAKAQRALQDTWIMGVRGREDASGCFPRDCGE